MDGNSYRPDGQEKADAAWQEVAPSPELGGPLRAFFQGLQDVEKGRGP